MFRIARFEREFFKLVDTSTAAVKVELSLEIVDFIYRYWILKRRAGGNKALLVPRGEEESLSSVKGEDTERDKMKMLVGIRQVKLYFQNGRISLTRIIDPFSFPLCFLISFFFTKKDSRNYQFEEHFY